MLCIDVEGMSEAELRSALAAHCSKFGLVNKVIICRPVDRDEHAFALVEMSKPSEARGVIEQIGGASSGVAAIIPLTRPIGPRPPGQKRTCNR